MKNLIKNIRAIVEKKLLINNSFNKMNILQKAFLVLSLKITSACIISKPDIFIDLPLNFTWCINNYIQPDYKFVYPIFKNALDTWQNFTCINPKYEQCQQTTHVILDTDRLPDNEIVRITKIQNQIKVEFQHIQNKMFWESDYDINSDDHKLVNCTETASNDYYFKSKHKVTYLYKLSIYIFGYLLGLKTNNNTNIKTVMCENCFIDYNIIYASDLKKLNSNIKCENTNEDLYLEDYKLHINIINHHQEHFIVVLMIILIILLFILGITGICFTFLKNRRKPILVDIDDNDNL